VLVLTRRPGESLRLGEDVRVTVLSVAGGQVRLGIEAPASVSVLREEVFERVVQANREAAAAPQAFTRAAGDGAGEEP
jgi:carbon storage regulator